MGIEQKKMSIFQNVRFSKSPILKKDFVKIHGLVFELVGLIVVKGIDVAQPKWL